MASPLCIVSRRSASIINVTLFVRWTEPLLWTPTRSHAHRFTECGAASIAELWNRSNTGTIRARVEDADAPPSVSGEAV